VFFVLPIIKINRLIRRSVGGGGAAVEGGLALIKEVVSVWGHLIFI
jgi:hypothetical protein